MSKKRNDAAESNGGQTTVIPINRDSPSPDKPSRKPREKARYVLEITESGPGPGKAWAPLEITDTGEAIPIPDFADSAETRKLFLSLQQMAASAGVPENWLRAEAEAGRIPFLKIGRKLLFNPTLVEQALLEQATGEVKREAMAWVEENVSPPARVRCVVVKFDVELVEETIKRNVVKPVA